MINNRMNEGVGKKIVEALKKQNDIEIIPVTGDTTDTENSETESMSENSLENETLDMSFEEDSLEQDDVFDQPEDTQVLQQNINNEFSNQINTTFEKTHSTMNFANPMQSLNTKQNFAKDLDEFEVPANVAVLKQLILQLPSGVSKQTGAQIIRQTMEALGISMKSVLQEAQQVQESLNSSSRECQANIMEYKRQIVLLENQVQKYSKQSVAINDIISLFIQTGN